MIHFRWLLLFGVSFVISDRAVFSHPGHSHRKSATPSDSKPASERRWSTDDATKPEFGSFVMARDGLVQIRRDDDSLVTIPWNKLSQEDQEFVELRMARIRAEVGTPLMLAQAGPRGNAPRENAPPLIAGHFNPFVKLKSIQTRWDDKFFYVESNGIPAHQMMVGITAWQQQVPIPQKYSGDNAWRIPLHPVEARIPATTKDRFLRGAIALAVNGIPIFNALNNRGDDAFLFGELDEFGGHCGRADDYHYHIAPVHLEKTIGKGNPIAYTLDGYPIYGYQDPQDPDFAPLDALNGHKDAQGRYHYHATKTYPYLNGGFHGEVVEKDGQVDPQPRAEPLRPALPPLRDAKIIDFAETKAGTYRLTYDVKGKKGTVSYTLADNGSATFEFVDPAGRKSTETYSPQRRGPGGRPRPPQRPGDNPPRGDRPPRPDERPSPRDRTENRTDPSRPQLTVSSSSISAQGLLSVDCTCDGKRESPAVAWKGAPAGTKAFAFSLWHTAPDQEKSYWLVYNIPATTTSLAQNAKPEGTVGMNDRRRADFDPMCSKGPGLKTYHITVFALSQKIDLPSDKVTRASLLEAIKGNLLAEGTLDFQYERKGQ